MGDTSAKINYLKSKIGLTFKPVTTEVSADMIRRFAQAIGDTNPMWQREGSTAGSTIAPPMFAVVIGNEDFQEHIADIVRGTMGGGLHVTTELDYYNPVCAGDTIVSTTKIVDVQQKESKTLGTIALVTFEITYVNQRRETVTRCRQVIVGHEIRDE